MNRGDTCYMMLNYQVNGRNLVNGAYDEIELQINKESGNKSIKKLLSKGEIVWKKITYTGGSFTGYVAYLDQNETYSLSAGESSVQIRIKMGGEVGSSETTEFTLGAVLSQQVI